MLGEVVVLIAVVVGRIGRTVPTDVGGQFVTHHGIGKAQTVQCDRARYQALRHELPGVAETLERVERSFRELGYDGWHGCGVCGVYACR